LKAIPAWRIMATLSQDNRRCPSARQKRHPVAWQASPRPSTKINGIQIQPRRRRLRKRAMGPIFHRRPNSNATPKPRASR